MQRPQRVLGRLGGLGLWFRQGSMSVHDAEETEQHPFLPALSRGWATHRSVRGPVIVAVSGGGDSVALLRGLQHLLAGGEPRQQLVVAHACHDLRQGQPGEPAMADAAFVRDLASSLGLPYVEGSLLVRAAVASGEGLEAAARRLRYAFLQRVAEEQGARLVVTAHSADDQAETVLHRALRGTGLAGLAGIASVRSLVEGMVVVRPMLGITAETARDYLRCLGQPWREDATNTDVRYARNLIRHELLPRMAAGPYPAVREALLRLAQQASDVHATTAAACRALLQAYAVVEASGSVLVKVGPLSSCPPQLLADLAATIWRDQGWPQRDMTARHYAAVARLFAQDPNAATGIDLPGGLRADTVPNGQVRLGPSQLRPHQDLQPHR